MKPTNPFEVCTPEMLPLVQEYGGKFGPLEALRMRQEFRDHVLDTVYLRNGQSYVGNGSITHPIVRASHPIDIRDMVGVLETLIASKDADPAEVNRLAEKIRLQAAETDVVDFANRSAEQGQYSPQDVIIGVQQLIKGVRATILAHPNRPAGEEEYVISWFREGKDRSGDPMASGTEIFSATFDKHGRQQDILGDTYQGPQRKPTPDDPYEGPSQANMMPTTLIELYERVRRTDLMRSDRAYVMEAVGDENDVSRPPIVCQLRDFKSRSLAGWRFDPKENTFQLPKLVFGITPEEGMRLTVQHSPDGFGSDRKTPLPVLDRPWAFLRTQHQGETPLTLDTTGMKAYLGGFFFGSGMASMAHSQERMAAVAKVTVFENRVNYHVPSRKDDPTDFNLGTYDFSRRLLAEMDDEPVRDADGGISKLREIRELIYWYSRNTNAYIASVDDLLDRTRGKMFDVILRSDGHTATLTPAPGQATRALVKQRRV